VQRTCCLLHSGFKARSVQRSSTFRPRVPPCTYRPPSCQLTGDASHPLPSASSR
jgi:hypothetical protein